MTNNYIKSGLIYTLSNDAYVVGNLSQWLNCGNALEDRNGMREIQILGKIDSNDQRQVTTILSNAFCRIPTIETVYIPKTITTIGGGAFCENQNLRNVIFEKNSQLTTIKDGAFRDCPSLEKIILPPSVKEIQYAAFANFSQLSYLVYCGTTVFLNYKIIYPKNASETHDLKIFVVHGLYLNNYFGKYRVISTSECISDRTIKARYLTCSVRNRYLHSILIFCFIVLK